MKVDYHFHPNIGGRKTIARRLAAVWHAIDRHDLDAVVCTEHVFKDAARAYRELMAHKPAHIQTHVFPGAEVLSSDEKGVDVIVFGLEDWYDRHPRLLKPFSMPLIEMIAYLEASDLSYYIPHPYLIKTPLKQLYKEDATMQAFLSSVPAVEAFNGCFLHLEHLCDRFPFRRVTRSFKRNLRASANPDPARMGTTPYKFLAVGSDAHHPKEIGFSVEVPCKNPTSRTAAFLSLTNNTDVTVVHLPTQRFALVRLFATGWTTLHEAQLKKRIHRKGHPKAKIMHRLRKMRPRSAGRTVGALLRARKVAGLAP